MKDNKLALQRIDKTRLRKGLRNYEIARKELAVSIGFSDKKAVERVVDDAVDLRAVQRGLKQVRTQPSAFNTLQYRRELWKNYSAQDENGRHKNMPRNFEALARSINVSHGFDKFSNFGYAVVYYAFTENKPLTSVMKMIIPGKFDGDIYLNKMRRRAYK